MKTLTRIALTGLTATALLATFATPDAAAQERERASRTRAPAGQTIQAAPQTGGVAGGLAGGAAIGGITTAPAPTGTPTLAQLGSSSAYVPMKHATTGVDANNHVLAIQNGNLNMRFKAGMTCPKGRTVIHYSAKPAGSNLKTFVNASTGSAGYSANVTLKPFSKSELETTCQQALGGGWASPGGHNNTSQIVKKTISKKIEVWGQCSGWANKTKRTYTALLTLTCDDKSWPIPPVG